MRFLHLHSTFDTGGKEWRSVALMRALGIEIEHHIVSAMPQAYGACALIGPDVRWRVREDFPPLAGTPTPARLWALGQAISEGGYDLVLSYNWGAMDAVLANRLFAHRPLVHHEDGFNADEAAGSKIHRDWWRRVALEAAHYLVVPSQSLQAIATSRWGQEDTRVVTIANGIDVARMDAAVVTPCQFRRVAGEWIIGTLAGLRPVKNLTRMVRIFAHLRSLSDQPMRLVIAGQGSEAQNIMACAQALGVAEHVLLDGFHTDTGAFLAGLDLFALTSDSEQFPIALVEAMATGLAAVASDVGDVRQIVAPQNLPFIHPPTEEAAMAQSWLQLLQDAEARRRIGQANAARVRAHYRFEDMVARYRALYMAAMA